MRAKNSRGIPAPWLWTRRQIAARWYCKPSEVSEAPWYEVQLEIQLMNIESRAASRPTTTGGVHPGELIPESPPAAEG